jgi:hypothetical protein
VTDPLALAAAVAEVGPLAGVDEAARALGMVQAAKAWLKEQEVMLKAGLLAQCKANGGSLLVGRTLYKAGHATETKCDDPAEALPELLTAAEGDLGVVAGCIAVNGLKPGACRKVMGAEAFARHFKTVRRERLEGKEQEPELIEIPLEYVKRS